MLAYSPEDDTHDEHNGDKYDYNGYGIEGEGILEPYFVAVLRGPDPADAHGGIDVSKV